MWFGFGRFYRAATQKGHTEPTLSVNGILANLLQLNFCIVFCRGIQFLSEVNNVIRRNAR